MGNIDLKAHYRTTVKAARMKEFGHPIFYYENIEGGHSASANLKQTAKRVSYEFVYLSRELGLND